MMSVFEQKMLQKFKKLLEQPDIEIEDVPGSVEYPVNGYKLITSEPVAIITALAQSFAGLST